MALCSGRTGTPCGTHPRLSNNFRGVGKNYINRNQFGGRIGGPIVRNKTFFFFLYEGQRRLEKQNVIATVLTEPAKSGVFRFFAGRQNGNFTSPATNRSVERDGSLNTLLDPATLRQINVLTHDPLRSRPDPSGFMQRLFAAMPKANDFTVGDGLNTAGYSWRRRAYTGAAKAKRVKIGEGPVTVGAAAGTPAQGPMRAGTATT